MINPFTLKGKTILVTGASSGIGQATAIECSKMGANVCVTARNEQRLSEVFNSLDTSQGQQHQMILADLATEEGLAQIVDVVPSLDGVASNAGVSLKRTPVKFLNSQLLQQTMDVNVMSHVILARQLFKKKKLNHKASYVFTASVGGTKAFAAGNTAYGISKAALESFSRFCAVEFASRQIRSNAVCPGMIRTPMTAPTGEVSEEDYRKDIEEHYLLGRYGEPEEVAHTIVFLLSNASSFITGVSILVDGGVSVIH